MSESVQVGIVSKLDLQALFSDQLEKWQEEENRYYEQAEDADSYTDYGE